MDQHETLLTLAEIASAFVGFSTIVVVFRSGKSGLQRLRLRGVAEIGIAAIVGAFLPLLVGGFGAEGATAWRLASLVFAPIALIGWIQWARGVRRAGYPATFGKPPFAPDVVANVTGQVLLWWNVVAPGPAAGTRYVAALLSFLLIAAMSFVASAFGSGTETTVSGEAEPPGAGAA